MNAHNPPSPTPVLVATMIACVVLLLLMGFKTVLGAACAEGDSLLVTPRYNRRGLIEKYIEKCGKPTSACKPRTGTVGMYDCMAFS